MNKRIWFPTITQVQLYRGKDINPSYLHSLWVGLVASPLNIPVFMWQMMQVQFVMLRSKEYTPFAKITGTILAFVFLLWCSLIFTPFMGLFGRVGANGEEWSPPLSS